MNNLKSILGYADDSPYRGSPYLDIQTPNGSIDMSNTSIPLVGMDETGYKKYLPPNSGLHQFKGQVVREMPMKSGGPSAAKAAEMLRDGTAQGHALTDKQKHYFQAIAHGWKPSHQQGGAVNPYAKSVLSYIFSDDQDPISNAPVADEQSEGVPDNIGGEDNSGDAENQMAMDAIGDETGMGGGAGNPYRGTYIPSHVTGTMAVAPIKTTDTPTGNLSNYAFDFFKKKGLAPREAAGIVGNLMQESGLFRQDVIEGTRTGDSGLGFGIAQWHPDRKKELLNWASKNNMNPYTFNTQLEYVYKEAKDRGDLDKIKGAASSKDAARIFAQNYERPKIIDPKRINYANSLYPYKKGGAVLNYKVWE